MTAPDLAEGIDDIGTEASDEFGDVIELFGAAPADDERHDHAVDELGALDDVELSAMIDTMRAQLRATSPAYAAFDDELERRIAWLDLDLHAPADPPQLEQLGAAVASARRDRGTMLAAALARQRPEEESGPGCHTRAARMSPERGTRRQRSTIGFDDMRGSR